MALPPRIIFACDFGVKNTAIPANSSHGAHSVIAHFTDFCGTFSGIKWCYY
jgi:hypothetical protein